uniref:Torsin-1A-interacting protein 1/2 AAA+ activator domain-containing protein n=1 Tax=Cyprinus carpio carpio TaxID=630221 RepID=A0A8C1F330_CYPCA
MANKRNSGQSGDSFPDNALKEDDGGSEKTTQIRSSSETENHPQSGTEHKTDMDREKGRKSEKKEGQSGDSLPDNASKEDDEKTTEIHSSSETENHPHSGTGPKRDMDREKGRKPERKEGQSGDSLPDNASKEDDEKTTEIHSSSETENHPHSGTGPKRDMDREKGRKPERKEEKTTEIHSSSETKSHPQSGTEHKTDMDSEKGRKPERKEGQSGDSLPDNASKEDDEKTTEIHSSSETEKHPHSGTEHKTDMDSEKGRKPERKEESPFKPEEDDTASVIHEEDVERDEKVQPQVIVPVNNKVFWTAAAVVLLAVVCALWQRSPDSTPPVPKEVNVVDVFNQEMKKLETTFPNQHPELWRRSLIHLRRHLKTKNPTEPVSLILTSDHRAEKTLGCLAQCLARAFSTAHNTSVLNINGKNKASQDSVQVKLDIDSELTKAFEGKKSAAVIHHFEELPPGSTLIFYRYCDHENAAYKDVFLVFTVMLDPEVELTSNDSLRRVGEMVKEHIKQKFVSSDKSAMFNQMDVDKLGGLWTRIAHLILPVAAEKKIEKQGCGDCESPLNIQKPEEEDTASVIHEEDVERDENVQAQIIVPVNNKKTTDIHSSSETENHPQSGTGPKRDMDREKGRKPERKEGLSGDSLPDNAPKEDDDAVQQGTDSTGHDTTEKSESSSEPEEKQTDAVQQGTDSRSDPGHDTTEKSESSSELEEKQTGPSVDSLPDNAPKEDDESPLNIQKPEEEDTASDIHEEDVERDENVQPQIIVPVNNKKTTHIHSSSETENHPQSGTGPKRDMDREKGRKPERKEGKVKSLSAVI